MTAGSGSSNDAAASTLHLQGDERRQRGRPFQPGRSGNPRGKRKGTRHRLTILAASLMEKDAKAVVQAVVSKAKDGDMSAARLVLDRVVPVRRGAPVVFDLPKIKTTGDLKDALGSILAAVAAGRLTPDEGMALGAVVDAHRKNMEVVELEERIAALEKRAKQS